MWMIEPPPALTMCGIAQRLIRNAPPTLTANTRFQAARSRSVTVALGSVISSPLTSTSRLTKAFTACSTAARVSDSEETSQRIGRNRLRSTLLTSRSTHATCAPASLKARAIAAPMPPTPATMADFPCNEYLSISTPSQVGFLHALVLLEHRARTGGDDAAGLQHVAAARGFQCVARVLLDQQYAGAGGVRGADALEDVLHHERREAERRLVHAEQARLG